MTAKKILLYLTIASVSLGILGYGAKYIYNLGKEKVKVESRDELIAKNANYVNYVENILRTELEILRKKIEKQGNTIHRIDKQLVAVSTHLKVAIIEEDE